MSGPTNYDSQGLEMFTEQRPAIVQLADLMDYINEMRDIYDNVQDLSVSFIKETKKTNNFILLSNYCKNDGSEYVDEKFNEALNYAISNKLSIRIDGKFLLKNNYVLPDNSIVSLFGDGIENSKLIFDNQTDNYSLSIKSYHSRPIKLYNLSIENKTNTKNGLKVEFGNGGWGGSVEMFNVTLNNFTSNHLNIVNGFSSSFSNVQLIGKDNGGNYSSVLLKIDKTNGLFSNTNKFDRCGFQYGKIGIQNLGGANYTFKHCQFEHLNLFLNTPLISNPSVSSRMNFENNWFEQVNKGIINSDLNTETLEPITPITNKSEINFLFFSNNYDGGGNPTPFLNSLTEPVRSKNFIISNGDVYRPIKFTGWIDIPLQNGWTGTLKAYKNSDSMITLVGNITPGTTTTNTIIASLPYRSEGGVVVNAINGNSVSISTGAFWIDTGSNLKVPSGINYATSPHSFSVNYFERQL